MNKENKGEMLNQVEEDVAEERPMAQARSALVDRRDDLSIENMVLMTVDELKDELEKRDLRTEGRKSELLARLLRAVVNSKPKQVEEVSDKNVNKINNFQKKSVPQEIPSFTIRDVEESLTYFSGDDKTSVVKWIERFEETSTLLSWNDLQKFIYGKRMLRGSAKQFISYEKGVTSWSTLKSRLRQEFRKQINSAIVHSELDRRHKRSDESYRQYVYAMQEIASQGLIEERALVYYVIKGMRDEESSKILLHRSNNLRELKINLQRYEEMKEANSWNGEFKKTNQSTGIEDKKPKCFSCNEFGHISFECQNKDDKNVSKVNQDKKELMLVLSDATDEIPKADVVIEEPVKTKVENLREEYEPVANSKSNSETKELRKTKEEDVDDLKVPEKPKEKILCAKEEEKEIIKADTEKEEKGKGKPKPVDDLSKKEEVGEKKTKQTVGIDLITSGLEEMPKPKIELKKRKEVDALNASFPEKSERRRGGRTRGKKRDKEISEASARKRGKGKDKSVLPLLSDVNSPARPGRKIKMPESVLTDMTGKRELVNSRKMLSKIIEVSVTMKYQKRKKKKMEGKLLRRPK